MYLLNDLLMSKLERVESELRKLSQAELRQVREWLDDIIEDELEFTPEFEHSIQQVERDMADGKNARVREPLTLRGRSDSDLLREFRRDSVFILIFCADANLQ